MERAAAPETGFGGKDTRGHAGRILVRVSAPRRNRMPARRARRPSSAQLIDQRAAGREAGRRDRWFERARAEWALPQDGTEDARGSAQSRANREIRRGSCALPHRRPISNTRAWTYARQTRSLG